MSAHSAYTWKHPALGLCGPSGRPWHFVQRVNPHGRRARRLALIRYWNAFIRGLPAKLPAWMCGPRPLPPGPNGSVTTPNSQPDPATNHGGTVRKVVMA